MQSFDDLWNYDQPGESEAAFRRLLPAAGATGSRSYLAQLLTQVARAQGLQRQFEEAHATLDEAAEFLDERTGVAQLRYLLERGRVFNSSGEPEKARSFFLRAWQEARAQEEDFYAVDAAHMMAIVESAEEQLGWNMRALELADCSPDQHARGWRGSLYNNIGWTYHAAGRYDEALGMFQQAVVCRREQGKLREVHIAEWCVARTLRSLGRYEEALERQRVLSELNEESDGFVDEEMGECLLALDRHDEARPHFARAHELLSQDIWLAANEPERIARLAELARSVSRAG